jgi:hypothetical protein
MADFFFELGAANLNLDLLLSIVRRIAIAP